MKKLLLAFIAMTSMTSAQQTLRCSPGTIWLSFEDHGHIWMVGAPKEYASAEDDPGFVQTDFAKGYVVKVNTGKEKILFHECCTKSVEIGEKYAGEIEIAGHKFTVAQFLKIWSDSTPKPLTQLEPIPAAKTSN